MTSWPRLEQVQELHLVDTDITDATCRLISNRCTQLIVLDLSGCKNVGCACAVPIRLQVTDVALDALSAAGSFTRATLQTLRIARCSSTMSVPDAFQSIQRLSKLKLFDVRQCDAFTPDECHNFESAFAASNRAIQLIRQ